MGLSALFDAFLDKTIVLSFDRTGFRRHARAFVAADLDVDLTGKTAIVTGANSGIGRATAAALLGRGATVVLACRDRGRGEAARAQLGGKSELELVDVSSKASVREFVRRWAGRSIDIVVHNAGVLLDELTLTAEGLETTWATHVVGPLLMTQLLRPQLAPGARVIWVSSGGMYTQRLDVKRLRAPAQADFDGVVQYAQAKRAQVILTEELAARLAPTVAVHAMHPGWADTSAVRTSLPRFFAVTQKILRDAAEGADTAVWLAAGPAQRSGQLWFDRRLAPPHLWRRTIEPEVERRALWAACMADAGL